MNIQGVFIVQDADYGWFVKRSHGAAYNETIAFCFTYWGARWKARRTIRKLQAGLHKEFIQ